MATIDIGKLTFTHKGDYAGGTAYVANDVVYYNGSAYVAKTSTTGNLPTSTAHWNTFAAGSGGIWNAGLSIGSANQLLRVNSGGNALEFHTPATVTSDMVKISAGTLGSDTANWSIDGHFSSTYQNYKIFINQLTTGDNGNTMYARMNTGGNPETSTQYSWSQINYYSTSAAHQGNNSQNMFRLVQNSNSDDYPACLEFTIFNPTNSGRRTQALVHGFGMDSTGGATNGSNGGVVLKIDTAVTGITIFSGSGGNVRTGAEYVVYGMK
jgi:hypothetical protein